MATLFGPLHIAADLDVSIVSAVWYACAFWYGQTVASAHISKELLDFNCGVHDVRARQFRNICNNSPGRPACRSQRTLEIVASALLM